MATPISTTDLEKQRTDIAAKLINSFENRFADIDAGVVGATQIVNLRRWPVYAATSSFKAEIKGN